jgi:acyl-CoA synthetase (AMP-forming)/AMP-acid ligase II
VRRDDGALVIFTTGSTGPPKPALLSHRNITCENMCISEALFGGDAGTVTLVNLPPSHVGCQTELLMGTLFGGGTAVILETFDPARSLKAVQEYKVRKLGQIPAMFSFEWRLKDYASYDLSSLEFVAYGGSAITRPFAERLATMAPRLATGLGLTECAGFCTYLLTDSSEPERIFASLGYAMPVYPLSIRKPMREDGTAGEELPAGELGCVCFRGPQTFLGYVNDPGATARTVSRDGWLYTGDLGHEDERGLHLTGRAKWVIKPFGYQVFPGEVENHFCALEEKVAACGVVGVEHAMISEAIVAFIEKKPGAELTVQELERHARGLASYMRPRHYVLLEPGQMPLNRVIKTDYVRLAEMAREEVERLRAAGRWDR